MLHSQLCSSSPSPAWSMTWCFFRSRNSRIFFFGRFFCTPHALHTSFFTNSLQLECRTLHPWCGPTVSHCGVHIRPGRKPSVANTHSTGKLQYSEYSVFIPMYSLCSLQVFTVSVYYYYIQFGRIACDLQLASLLPHHLLRSLMSTVHEAWHL